MKNTTLLSALATRLADSRHRTVFRESTVSTGLVSAVPLAQDLSAPLPVVLLLAGLLLLTGFAAGLSFEQVNLRARERRLARGRRLLAAQARGLRRQLAAVYRTREEEAVEVDET